MTEPTDLDRENAERRAKIAERFRSQYEEARLLAEQVFGPGYRPTGRHFLLDKAEEDRCRRTGEKPVPAAQVITVQNAAGVKRHFRVETMRECATVEEGFGEMLLEPDLTRTVSWGGKDVHLHKYSLCWSWYEPDYRPASAEKLAAMREKREERAVEKEAEGAPLFADLIREEGYVKPKRKGRGR